MKSFKQEKPFSHKPIHPELHVFAAVCLLALLLVACTRVASLPKEVARDVKDSVIGQDQLFNHPLDSVLKASVLELGNDGFAIIRIESYNRKGYIHANQGNTNVKLFLETNAPDQTKIASKIQRGKDHREYTLDGLFGKVARTLDSRRPIIWSTITRGMVKAYASPDSLESVIAYLGAGAEIELIGEEGAWGRIKLKNGGVGYVPMQNLGPSGTSGDR